MADQCAHHGWDAVLAQCAEAIASHGWNLTATAGFAYTTGLTDGGHPELLIAGLDPYTAHDVVSAAVRRIRDGIPLRPGNRYPAIVSDYLVVIRELDLETPRFPRNVTTAHYGRPVPAVQIVYPDAHGHFPGEPGCRRAIEEAQDPDRRPGG